MRLGELLAALPAAEVDWPTDREIVSIETDGRRVGPCDMFVAYFFTRPAVLLLSRSRHFQGKRLLGVEIEQQARELVGGAA